MKTMKRTLQILFAMLALVCSPILVYAADYKEVSVTTDGTVNKVEYNNSVYCTFTAETDGTISFSCLAESDIRLIELKKYYNGVYSFKNWIESSSISSGETKTADFHVDAGQKYAIEIDALHDDILNKATITMTFKPDQTITSITFGQPSYRISCDDTLEISDITILPANAVNKDLEWDYDKDAFYAYPNNRFLAKKAGVYTLTAKAVKGNAQSSVTVYVLPKKISQVTQDTTKTTQNEILMKWTTPSASGKVDGYHVYRYDTSKKKWILQATTTKNTLKVKKLKPETKYQFKVIAFVKNGTNVIEGESGKGTYLYTAPKKISATAITSIKTISSNTRYNHVSLKWKKVKGATGYKIYGKGPGGKFKVLSTTRGTTDVLSAGRGYTYSIKIVPYRTWHNITTDGKASKIKKYTSKLN